MQIYEVFHWTRRERLRWFFLLLSGTCLLYATRTSVPLAIPVISKEKLWDKTDSGIILSSFFWGYSLTQILSGYVSDRIGGHKVMCVAALGWSTTVFFMPNIIRYGISHHFSIHLVVLIRAFNGALQGMHFPSMISLTSQRMHEAERASFFSLLMSGSALGTLLAGSLGSYILDNYSWDMVFHVLGLMSLIWAGYLIYFSLSLKEDTFSIDRSKKTTVPIKELIRKPPFWACVIGHACQNNCFFVLLSWMPTYFHETFPEVKSWIVNMVPWLPLFPCTYLGKLVSEHLIRNGYSITQTRKIIQTSCFLTQALNLLFLVEASTPSSAILCLSFIIGASGFHSNAIAVNPSDLAPKHSGIVFGIMNTIGAVPGFVGVYFAGYILHLTQSWAGVFIIISLIEIFGCILFLVYGSGQAII